MISFFFFISSKRSHGQTDLAPRKALKTAPVCAASAALGLVVQPTLSQGVSPQGARASSVSGERAPEAGSSIEAAVALGEAAGVAAASSPPDALPALAPASAEVAAVLAVESPVAADAEMAEAPLLEAGDRKLAPLAEEVPDAPTAGGADALEEGGAEPRSVLGSGDLIPARRDPNERRGQALRF